MTPEQVEQLWQEGRLGLDGSPGNPISKEAHLTILNLLNVLGQIYQAEYGIGGGKWPTQKAIRETIINSGGAVKDGD